MKSIKVKCKKCNKTFKRSSSRFNEAVKFGWNQYCSRKCEYKYKTKRQIIKCENCSKKFERVFKDISRHNYCSSSCAAIINNRKYPRWQNYMPPLKVCEQCGSKYRKSNKKYCSRKCRNEKYIHAPEDLIKIIQNTGKRLKRVPTRRELDNINDSCIKVFGSWNKAVLAAGFIPNRSHDDRMYKRIISRAIDGHNCDSVSEVLIDNWLYKNNIPHLKDINYPTTNHVADWKLTVNKQDFFVEYFGLANDSPRYDRSIRKKQLLCKKENIALIEIYPKDLYPTNKMNSNLKNKFGSYLTI